MANTFKKVLHRLRWAMLSGGAPNAHAAGACVCSDMRSDVSRNPFVYQLVSATVLNRFNIVSKSWNFVQSPALAGTFGAGANIAFVPSLGCVGTIAAGATTSKVTLSTALPSAVGQNMLANRGGSGEYGFKLRIIDTVAGKTEERFIVANTLGTAPTINVLSPFTFIPSTGARYEIIAGRVFMLGAGTSAANIWRSLEIATNTLSSGLSIVGLPATIATDSSTLVLDEQYTPYDCLAGEGMIKGTFVYDTGLSDRNALSATAAGASTLTGQATLGDSVVLANEYRNFQIRVVQDTENKTAVGQRRIISSHTAGPSPVYTLGTAWTVTPSSSAKFVIELPNLMLVRSSAVTTVFTYNYGDATINNGTNSIAAGAWSTTYFGAAPTTNQIAGMWAPGWGIQPDDNRNARHSMQYFFRGSSTTLEVLDIAASITGTWTGALVYDGAVVLTAATSGAYAPYGNEGRMFYMNIYVASALNQIYRFDVKNRVMSPFTNTEWLQAGTAAAGNRMAAYAAIDGLDTYDVVFLQSHLSTACMELVPLV